MHQLGRILKTNQSSYKEFGYKVIFVYTAEAHADDVWPAGYGINQTKSLEERKQNAENLFQKFETLAQYRDQITVLIDNMDNDFINTTGAWPEGYMLASKDGTCELKTSFIYDGAKELEKVEQRMQLTTNIPCFERAVKKIQEQKIPATEKEYLELRKAQKNVMATQKWEHLQSLRREAQSFKAAIERTRDDIANFDKPYVILRSGMKRYNFK